MKIMMHEDGTECEEIYWPPGSKKLLIKGQNAWCTAHGLMVQKVTKPVVEEEDEIPPYPGVVPPTRYTPIDDLSVMDLFYQEQWWLSKDGWIMIHGMTTAHLEQCIKLFGERPRYFTDKIVKECRQKLMLMDITNTDTIHKLLQASLDIGWINGNPGDYINNSPLVKKMKEVYHARTENVRGQDYGYQPGGRADLAPRGWREWRAHRDGGRSDNLSQSTR